MKRTQNVTTVTQDLRRLIIDLKPGDKIPTVRALMQEFGVSQSLIAQAALILKQEGLIDSHVGRGTFILGQSNRQRILWICGLDVFRDEISPFYTHSLRLGHDLLDLAGWDVDVAWLPSARPEASASYCNDNLTQRYAGLIFIGCRPDHVLLNYAAWQRIPHIRIQSHSCGQHDIVGSPLKRARAIFSFLQDKHIDELAVLMDRPGLKVFKELASIAGIRIEELSFVMEKPHLSDFQWTGYQTISNYLSDNPTPRALYISDDIIAQGAIRALQVHTSANQLENMHIIIATAIQTLVPYSVPVSYLVFDIRDSIACVIAQLQAQLEKRDMTDAETTTYRILERPSIDQLTSYTAVSNCAVGITK